MFAGPCFRIDSRGSRLNENTSAAGKIQLNTIYFSKFISKKFLHFVAWTCSAFVNGQIREKRNTFSSKHLSLKITSSSSSRRRDVFVGCCSDVFVSTEILFTFVAATLALTGKGKVQSAPVVRRLGFYDKSKVVWKTFVAWLKAHLHDDENETFLR